MKDFLDKDFLLQTETAKELYHEHAEKMPIIDYHCHLIPQMVAENKRFESIAQIWLMGDHYKWRAMRSNGVDERFCTGKDTTDWEKFEKWAETVPYTFRNPLYHWTHLELKTAFGIDKRLNPETAKEIYDECNNQIANDPKFCPQGMMAHYNVKVVCTTDDPADTLEWHKMVAAQKDAKTRMIPAWRPDAAMNIEAASWKGYIDKLQAISGVAIVDFKTLNDALQKRHDFFATMGCKLSDH
ncbi:MAG: glucuronate isomerase, partial [Paludibacteraceae bacterium]|nr:glucuronate isomerase [Paludibacteraceae bacterium]